MMGVESPRVRNCERVGCVCSMIERVRETRMEAVTFGARASCERSWVTGTMLAPTLVLTRSAVPVVTIRAVLGRACRDRLFRVRTEELEAIGQVGVNAGWGEWGRIRIRTEVRRRVRVAYLVTITRLTEVHGLWVGDGPHTIAISTIDLS
jgi:hypothetical protein